MERWIPLALGLVLGAPTPLQIHRRLEKIAGSVVDEDGRGIGGAKVSAIASDSTEATSRGVAVTGPDGSFVIRGLYRGVHDLVAEAPGYAKGTRSWIETGDRQVRIPLTLLRAVDGRVFDAASGEALPTFVLQARGVVQPGSGKFRWTAFGDRPFQARDGRFVFDGLLPGRYALLARADGYAQTYSREFEIGRGSETAPLEIGLSRGGRIVGRLVDAKTGKGVLGATITTLDGDFEDNPFVEIFRPYLVTNVSVASVRSSGDGTYLLDHLMPGSYQVEIEHPSYTKTYVRGLAVQEGLDATVPDVTMLPGATIRGLAVNASGAPFGKANVTVRTTAAYRSGRPPLCRTRTDADGRFPARHLPAGEYVVAVSPGREENSNPFIVIHDWPTRSTVLLGEGEEVELRIVVGR